VVNFLPTFRDNLSVPSSRDTNQIFLIAEGGTDILSRNVGTLRNDPEERNSHLLRGGSLKSCKLKAKVAAEESMKAH
jgi:hypothetical protein